MATAAGIKVSEDTALRFSAVFACINVLSQDVAKLPWGLFQHVDTGKVAARKHPVYKLLHSEPNGLMTSFAFRRTGMAWMLAWGNFYARIIRNNAMRPVSLDIMPAWDVSPEVVAGKLYYHIHSTGETLQAWEVYHVAGLGFDGIKGMSVIKYARQSIALGMAAENFGASFFGEGATIGGFLTTDKPLNDTQRSAIKKSWHNAYHGTKGKHGTAVLEGGLHYERVGIPPEDAQFLETRQFQVPEICRWFRLPPHKIHDLTRSTNNNIEHQSIEYVTDTLAPHLVNWEQEADRKLLREDEKGTYFNKFNLNGLLRGDVKARGEFYAKLFTVGALSQNDIRRLEDQNDIPNGDKYYVPLNMIDSNAPAPDTLKDSDKDGDTGKKV